MKTKPNFSILKKAIPLEDIDHHNEFHIIWNPYGPNNPRYAFHELEDAQILQEQLMIAFPDCPFFYVMTHKPGY